MTTNTITVKDLNTQIRGLGVKLQNNEAAIQELGLHCLQHATDHGPQSLCNLLNVLRKGMHKAFTEWALAFGQVKKNTDKKTKDALPFVIDRSRKLDIEGATTTPWFAFQASKADATEKAFDLQEAFQAFANRLSGKVTPAQLTQLQAMAAVVGAKCTKVVAVEKVGVPTAPALPDTAVA